MIIYKNNGKPIITSTGHVGEWFDDPYSIEVQIYENGKMKNQNAKKEKEISFSFFTFERNEIICFS